MSHKPFSYLLWTLGMHRNERSELVDDIPRPGSRNILEIEGRDMMQKDKESRKFPKREKKSYSITPCALPMWLTLQNNKLCITHHPPFRHPSSSFSPWKAYISYVSKLRITPKIFTAENKMRIICKLMLVLLYFTVVDAVPKTTEVLQKLIQLLF